jgi:hypothetical protein
MTFIGILLVLFNIYSLENSNTTKLLFVRLVYLVLKLGLCGSLMQMLVIVPHHIHELLYGKGDTTTDNEILIEPRLGKRNGNLTRLVALIDVVAVGTTPILFLSYPFKIVNCIVTLVVVFVVDSKVLGIVGGAPSKHYYAMSKAVLVYSTLTMHEAVTLLIDFYGEVFLVTGAKASLVGYIDAKIGIPLPLFNKEMNVEH